MGQVEAEVAHAENRRRTEAMFELRYQLLTDPGTGAAMTMEARVTRLESLANLAESLRRAVATERLESSTRLGTEQLASLPRALKI